VILIVDLRTKKNRNLCYWCSVWVCQHPDCGKGVKCPKLLYLLRKYEAKRDRNIIFFWASEM